MRVILVGCVALAACGTVEGDGDGGPDIDEPPTCVDQYGDATGFVPCFEESVRCVFQVAPLGSSCDDVCGGRGGECEAAHGSDASGAECALGAAVLCDARLELDVVICECSRGCGGGVACSGGLSCEGGACL